MLNSDDLRFFCRMAQNETLAATARVLGVSTSSVSQRLHNIEEKLALKLLSRNGRSLVLTDEGREFLERAQAIISEIDELESSLSARKSGVFGHLKVLAPLGFGQQFIAPLVAKFQSHHSNLSVDLELTDNPHRSKQNWDILIHIGELRDTSLIKVALAANDRFLCASPSYLARFGEPKQIDQLMLHHCLVLRENDEDVSLWKFRTVNQKTWQSIRVHSSLTSNDGRVIKQWAIDGYGIIQRSEWDLVNELQNGTLQRVLSNYLLPSADVVALLPSRASKRSTRTKLFLKALQEHFSPIPWRR